MTEARSRTALTESDASASAEHFLAMARAIEPALQAFRSIDPDSLLAAARAYDEVPAARRGPLHGLLVGVKEVYDVAGRECAWGSPIHAGRRASHDAAAVGRLCAAGALIAGITVSTEYAMARPGPTTNPFDATRTPGASSQGSAAAVGARLVPAALGTQTIGSIIRPAAYCGVIGVKPTWGTVDLAGCMPLSEPLDHVGIVAANAALAGRLLDALDGGGESKPLRAARVMRPWYTDPTEDCVLTALDQAALALRAAGLEVTETELPPGVAAAEEETLDTLLSHDMARHHGGDFDRAPALMSDRVQDYIRRGRAVSAARYDAAMARRKEFADMLDTWAGEAVVIMPAATGIAPLLKDGTGARAPQRLWSLTGLPAVAVPVGLHQGLPVGLQVVARRGADRLALAAAGLLARQD